MRPARRRLSSGSGSGSTFYADDLTVDELQAYVSEHVASYKQVRLVEFIDEIPKSASGKILRRMLRDG